MWKYIKRYLPLAVIAGLFTVGEVLMDLVQPGIMSRIVDEGVLGLETGGVGDLKLIFALGLQMIGLVLFGGFCGSMNNVFVHLSGQNIGNEMRKDAFRHSMAFSFSQMDRFGAGTLVTRVTNDITQVQNFVSQFVRGMIRCSFLTLGSITFMFMLNREFGLIMLCVFPFIVGVMAFCLGKANPLFSRLQAQLDKINSIMQEDVYTASLKTSLDFSFFSLTNWERTSYRGDTLSSLSHLTRLLTSAANSSADTMIPWQAFHARSYPAFNSSSVSYRYPRFE